MVEEEIQRLESVALRLDEQSLDDATGLIKRLYEQPALRGQVLALQARR